MASPVARQARALRETQALEEAFLSEFGVQLTRKSKSSPDLKCAQATCPDPAPSTTCETTASALTTPNKRGASMSALSPPSSSRPSSALSRQARACREAQELEARLFREVLEEPSAARDLLTPERAAASRAALSGTAAQALGGAAYLTGMRASIATQTQGMGKDASCQTDGPDAASEASAELEDASAVRDNASETGSIDNLSPAAEQGSGPLCTIPPPLLKEPRLKYYFLLAVPLVAAMNVWLELQMDETVLSAISLLPLVTLLDVLAFNKPCSKHQVLPVTEEPSRQASPSIHSEDSEVKKSTRVAFTLAETSPVSLGGRRCSLVDCPRPPLSRTALGLSSRSLPAMGGGSSNMNKIGSGNNSFKSTAVPRARLIRSRSTYSPAMIQQYVAGTQPPVLRRTPSESSSMRI